MRTAPPFALLLAACLGLAACGFQPMYAPSAQAPGGGIAGAVTIPEIEGKSGHVLRKELSRLLDVGVREDAGAPRRLEIALNEQTAPLGFRPNESATRADLQLTAVYVLREADGRETLRGGAQTVVSYDIPLSAFGEIAAQNDARERAAENLAERIRADLALKLRTAARP